MKKLQRTLLPFFALVALASGGYMWHLNSIDTLWGHLPLFFYVSVWAVIVLGLGNRYSRHPKNARFLALSTLSGVLLSVGFPPLPFPFLMFVGFVPLLLLEKEIFDEHGDTNKKLLLRYAYNTFVVWNILTTWWVGNTAFVAGIVAIWLNAFFMCIPILLFHQSKKNVPRTAYLGFIVYWLCFEFLHLNWEISWVWLNLGNSFASLPWSVQWYEYTGTFGGSLWILYANYLIFNFVVEKFYKKSNAAKSLLPKIAAVVLLPVLVSLGIYFTYKEKGEAIEVTVGQPNYEPHYKKFSADKARRDAEIINLIENNVSDTTEYFVLPETLFSNLEEDKPDINQTVRKMQPLLRKYPNLKILTGVSAYNILEKDEADTKATRQQKNREGKVVRRYEALNAAVQLQYNQPTQTYRKSLFVPGAELLPYKKFFFFLEPLVDKLDGSMEGLGTQERRTTFTSPTANVAPVICYESVFGEYTTGYLRQAAGKGANFIAVMTNDGWWDNTAGHKQHLMFASLRAIETRRDVARSANTGVSAFINQRGDITARTAYDERVALSGRVRLNKEVTFYTYWRDLIARIALFTALLLLVNTFVMSRLPKKAG